jgi:RNA polymerase sigma-70 factor (ECF subfamily)
VAVAIEGTADDGSEFARVYEEVYPSLVNYCRRLAGPGGDPEGLAQEALFRGWRSWDPESGRPFWPWALTVARNLAIDHQRREGRRIRRAPAIALAAAGERFPQPEDEMVRAAEHHAVREAFEGLPAPYQTVLNLHHVEGQSYQEIADLQGVSTEVVRGMLRRGRQALRAAYMRLDAVSAVVLVGVMLRRARNALTELAGRTQARLAATGNLQVPVEAVKSAMVLALVLAAGAPNHVTPAPPSEAAAGPTAAVPERGTSAPTALRPIGGGATAGGPRRVAVPPVPPAPLRLLPDGTTTPEQAIFTGLTASKHASSDGTVFAVGEGTAGCATVTCPVLFRSTDLGTSWHRLPGAGFRGGTVMLPPAWPADPRIFALGENALVESDDDGATFVARTPAGRKGAMSPGFSDGDPQIWVGFLPGWIYHDDSKLVTPLDMWPPSAADYATYAFSPAWPRDHRVLVGGWAPETVGLRQGTVTLCEQKACHMPVALPNVVGSPEVLTMPSFTTTGVAFAWADGHVFRTRNAGRTFAPVALPDDAPVTSLVADGERLYLATAAWAPAGPVGGLYVSDDLGSTWRRLGAGTPLASGVGAVTPLPEGRILAAPQAGLGNGLLCSADNGRTWAARCPS